MNDYVIYTDTGCDIPGHLLKQWGVEVIDLTFRFEDADREYTVRDMEIKEFYDRMRDGAVAKTAAVNLDAFKTSFASALEQGKDVLYVAFSSGLSSTYHTSTLAAEELMEEYPGRKVLPVDTLAASAGHGMLIYLAVEQKKQGATLEEAARCIEENKLHLCHWFTVDDLVYLKRGGRVSPTVALVGGLLGIKPVLHMDNEGHLINRGKVRGRKASLAALVDEYEALALEPGKAPVYICNADCADDVEILKDMLRERCGAEVDLVVDIGPVIGAHCGPGTIAVFFLGKER